MKALRKLINKYKDGERTNLTLHEVDGYRLYTFPSSIAPPNTRNEIVMGRLQQISLGMQHEDQLAFNKTLKDTLMSMNSENWQAVQLELLQLQGYYEGVITQPINLTPMLYLAMPIILLEKEKILDDPNKYEKKKLSLIEKNAKVRDFFLKMAENMLTTYRHNLDNSEAWVMPKQTKAGRWYEKEFLKNIGSSNYKSISLIEPVST